MCTFQATTVKPINSSCRHFLPKSRCHQNLSLTESVAVWQNVGTNLHAFGSVPRRSSSRWSSNTHHMSGMISIQTFDYSDFIDSNAQIKKKKKGWKCPKSPENDVPLDSFALEVSKWVKNTSRKVRELTLWGCCVCQALSTLWWLVCEFTSDQYLCTENDVVKLLGFQKNILVLGYMLWVTYTIQRGKLWLSANGRNVSANTFQLRNLFNALLRIMYSMVICARGLLSCN